MAKWRGCEQGRHRSSKSQDDRSDQSPDLLSLGIAKDTVDDTGHGSFRMAMLPPFMGVSTTQSRNAERVSSASLYTI